MAFIIKFNLHGFKSHYNLLIIGSSCLLNTKKINFFFKEEEKGFIEDHKLNYS